MEITISKKQARVPVTIVQVSGKIDAATYQDFTQAVRNAVLEGAQYVLLDLSACDYMSSAGIRSLNEIYLLLGKSFSDATPVKGARSRRLKLFNPTEKVLGILAISGVDAFFEIHKNLETAVASF